MTFPSPWMRLLVMIVSQNAFISYLKNKRGSCLETCCAAFLPSMSQLISQSMSSTLFPICPFIFLYDTCICSLGTLFKVSQGWLAIIIYLSFNHSETSSARLRHSSEWFRAKEWMTADSAFVTAAFNSSPPSSGGRPCWRCRRGRCRREPPSCRPSGLKPAARQKRL